VSRVIYLHGRQFQQQNVFRSITIGLQPFLPLTQRYRMALSGLGQQGYFTLAPRNDSSNVPTPYMWPKRINPEQTGLYQSIPEANNWQDSLKTYNNMAGEASTSAIGLGSLLSRMIDANVSVRTSKAGLQSSSGAPRLPSDVNEIEALLIGKELERITGFTGSNPEMELLNDPALYESAKTKRKAGMSTENIDILFGHDKGGAGIYKAIEETFGKKMVENTAGLEMTIAKAGSRAAKSFARFTKTQIQQAGSLRQAFENKVDQDINEINSRIADFADQQVKAKVKIKKEDRAATVRAAFGNSASAIGDASTDLPKLARELIDRITVISNSPSAAGYLYQVPLGALEGGMMGMVRLSAGTQKHGYPKIIKDMVSVEFVGGLGNVSDMLTQAGLAMAGVDGIEFSKRVGMLKQQAIDTAIATESRIGLLGHVVESDATLLSEGSVDITVGAQTKKNNALTGLATADIAEDILRQIQQFYTNPQVQGNFRFFFEKLLKESSDLSDVWKDKSQGQGKGMSENFIYNDYAKAFRGMGVWTKGTYSWKDEQYGENVSVSPFLTSRRAGVYAFDGKQITK